MVRDKSIAFYKQNILFKTLGPTFNLALIHK